MMARTARVAVTVTTIDDLFFIIASKVMLTPLLQRSFLVISLVFGSLIIALNFADGVVAVWLHENEKNLFGTRCWIGK